MAVDIAQLLAFAVKNNAFGPASVGGRAADDSRRRGHEARQYAGSGAQRSAQHGVRHHERQAAQGLRRILRDGFLVRNSQARPIPRERVQPKSRRRRRVPQYSVDDPVIGRAERAENLQRSVHAASRSRAGYRTHRFGQIHDPCRHGHHCNAIARITSSRSRIRSNSCTKASVAGPTSARYTRDTLGFTEALRSALREDPDVVLVGEMRDLETIRLALTAAETGHLVFGTLHTSSPPNTR